MHGFVAYHKLSRRQRFIDEIYVRPKHRRTNVAKSLLHRLCTGPLQLIVAASNPAALQLYAKFGFCVVDDACVYEPRRDELCMRTTSYLRTRDMLAAYHLHDVVDVAWDEIPERTQMQMVACLARHFGVSDRAAKARLRTTDSAMRYVLCK